jgi:Transposase IS66 family/DDE_Tnp_1-associated
LLAGVSDGRPGRGRDHPVAAVLALAAAAVVAGSRSFTAIAGWAADVPAGVREDLYRQCGAARPGTAPPSKATIWRVVTGADTAALDAVTGAWLMQRASAAGSLAGAGPGRDNDAPLIPVRVDGKTIRGARNADGSQVHLLAALAGQQGVVAAQTEVGAKTNEIPMITPLLDGVDLDQAVVTADALCRYPHKVHVQRELQAVADLAPQGAWCWAVQAADAITAMRRLVTQAVSKDAGQAGPASLAAQVTRYRSAALAGLSQTAARSGKLMKKHNALARRLLDRQDDYLRFTRDRRVPPDNNAAEREIRMIKVRQKVSGCLRTLTGARQFCAIRSYLATAAKHGISFLDALVMLAESRPWMPESQLA